MPGSALSHIDLWVNFLSPEGLLRNATVETLQAANEKEKIWGLIDFSASALHTTK